MRRSFVPISLANPFYSSCRLLLLWERILFQYDEILFVPCDVLRYLTYQGRGEMYPHRLVKKQRYDLSNQIRNIAKKVADRGGVVKYQLIPFSDIMDFVGFQTLKERLQVVCYENATIKNELEVYCGYWSRRAFGATSQGLADIQREYLLMETALSLYVTEKLGYCDEYYASGEWMFVNWLYSDQVDIIKRICERQNVYRKFFEIDAVLSNQQADIV